MLLRHSCHRNGPFTPTRSCIRRDTAIAASRTAAKDPAAALLESVTELSLRARLKQCEAVTVRVDCTLPGLLSGQVTSVNMEGRGWESPQGLTARLFDLSLGQVAIDTGAVLFEQRIKLAQTPMGKARVQFTARDFGAFLNHPLMLRAAATAVQGQPFNFDSHSVTLHMEAGVQGAAAHTAAAMHSCVLFTGSCGGKQYHLRLHSTGPHPSTQPMSGAGLRISARHMDRFPDASNNAMWLLHHGSDYMTDDEALVSRCLSQFFSTLLIDLQGAELRFASLQLARCNGTVEPVLDLGLSLRVREFPPLNVQF